MRLKDWLKQHKNVFRETDLRFLIREKFAAYPSWELDDIILTSSQLNVLEHIKNRYLGGVPLAYILQKEEFFGLMFKVTPSVLIPRPETERIVQEAVLLIEKMRISSVLDLGCGCGAMGMSIKKEVKRNIFLCCSDISFDALEVALYNKEQLGIEAGLINTNLLSGFRYHSFDLIVSNPPYVASPYIKGMLRSEPSLALDGGPEGINMIRRIGMQAERYLKKGGYLILEIGYDQKGFVEKFFAEYGWKSEKWIKDYSGHWRGAIFQAHSRKGQLQESSVLNQGKGIESKRYG